jgi:hypothetical protein
MRKYCDSKTAEHDGGGILILNQCQKQVFVGLVG